MWGINVANSKYLNCLSWLCKYQKSWCFRRNNTHKHNLHMFVVGTYLQLWENWIHFEICWDLFSSDEDICTVCGDLSCYEELSGGATGNNANISKCWQIDVYANQCFLCVLVEYRNIYIYICESVLYIFTGGNITPSKCSSWYEMAYVSYTFLCQWLLPNIAIDLTYGVRWTDSIHPPWYMLPAEDIFIDFTEMIDYVISRQAMLSITRWICKQPYKLIQIILKHACEDIFVHGKYLFNSWLVTLGNSFTWNPIFHQFHTQPVFCG